MYEQVQCYSSEGQHQRFSKENDKTSKLIVNKYKSLNKAAVMQLFFCEASRL